MLDHDYFDFILVALYTLDSLLQLYHKKPPAKRGDEASAPNWTIPESFAIILPHHYITKQEVCHAKRISFRVG